MNKTEGKIRTNLHPATADDQPIYRGTLAAALGQQLMDIRAVGGAENIKRDEITAARSRLEQTQQRNKAQRETRAAGTGGLNIGMPSEGGFFLQDETSADLMNAGFNNSEVLSRCDSRTLGTGKQATKIVGVDEKSRADGYRAGGIRVYTTPELDEITQSRPQLKLINIEPKKLTGFYYVSEEMTQDVVFLGQEMKKAFGEEFAFVGQDQVLNGSGAGQALGILNANCTIVINKETGQTAKTILTNNLSKMWTVFSGRSAAAVWLTNRNINSQLDELATAIGTGGIPANFVKYGPDGILRIKGAPVVEIEQCATLGTVGDIILADLGQYVTANKGDINETMSIHLKFVDAQNSFRFIYYFDGQPRFAEPVTPFKGASGVKVSPFVVLATRA